MWKARSATACHTALAQSMHGSDAAITSAIDATAAQKEAGTKVAGTPARLLSALTAP